LAGTSSENPRDFGCFGSESGSKPMGFTRFCCVQTRAAGDIKRPSKPSALGYPQPVSMATWRGFHNPGEIASPGFTCAICKWTRIIIFIICIFLVPNQTLYKWDDPLPSGNLT
jgi:hypothetical protein